MPFGDSAGLLRNISRIQLKYLSAKKAESIHIRRAIYVVMDPELEALDPCS